MHSKLLMFLLFFGVIQNIVGQGTYPSAAIPTVLSESANAILRNEEIVVEIEAIDKMTVLTKRVVTVLNKAGERHIAAGQFYDKAIKIKKQSAVIYDATGKEIKKIKGKKFSDRSLVSSNDLYSDNRVKYLDYTPQDFPFTVVYESEVQMESTIFISPWKPVSDYFISVESSSYVLKNPTGIPLRFEEKNWDGIGVRNSNSDDEFRYSVKNIPAYKPENLSPNLNKFIPQVLIAMNEFSLVGVKGKASNWDELGKWQYDNLLAGKNELSPVTVDKINSLTSGAQSDLEKAKLIYQYVQDNTRYISVQLGIGGWEPMPANDVDRLGYGDCKGLTMYTKALLESQNIPSYYAVVYAGDEKYDIDEEFASMQGNHVILNIPQEEEDVWLECTSQTIPFNYLGNFTDNRNVLLIKPEGGEIVKTKTYSASENLQESYTSVQLDKDGAFQAKLKRLSHGIPYGNIYSLMRKKEKDQVLFYKEKWGHIQNLNIEKIYLDNNRAEKQFTEEVIFKGERFASKAGKRLLMPINLFSPGTYNLQRYSSRKLPFETKRGYTNKDVYEFFLPEGYELESIPEEVKIENEFGLFRLAAQVKEKDGEKYIEVERLYVVNDGNWPAASYVKFRDFINEINLYHNQKAVIIPVN